MPTSENTFHLGLTMAGAVSAGCYTSGVIDYLFEVLDLWEKAKRGNVQGIDQNLVPKHNVIIDAMGGTSAGGMTTIISTLYALKGKLKPVKKIPENPMENQNVLYDSWVHLDDNEEKTFKKIWDVDDLDGELTSLFNSKVIDAIATKALDMGGDVNDFESYVSENLPRFISKDLEILLSHTLLRGIPLSVDFKTEIARRLKNSPMHNTFEHYLVSHFKLNSGNPVNENSYLWFNPFKEKYSDKIKLSTISTGAFPIGLAYRKFDNTQFSDEYIKSVTRRVIFGDFGSENPDVNHDIELNNYPENYSSISVDGGAINNEPYREVGSILRSKFHKDENEYQNYGLIMIDPFPDNDDIERKYKEPKNLLKVVPAIIQTLWNQAKVKRKEMLEQYNHDFFKGVIYPIKHRIINGEYKGRDKNPIISASFNAFGGFLDVNFRVHDFFLGRNNARNFVQYFGCIPYDPDNGNVHPIHREWTNEMVEKFKVSRRGDERIFLPIIPDLNLLLEGKEPGDDKYNYTYKGKPKYNPSELFKLKDNIYNRFKKVLDKGFDSFGEKTEEESETPISDALIRREYRRNWFQRMGDNVKSWVVGKFKNPVKKAIASMLSKFVIKSILEDLEQMEVLDDKAN
ncbi:MAG: hypothetical protein HWD85_06220 [Flavobacteriaceae bacterium]|nr:hypothetical protein [Flavobacteriaceae bacterium]